MRMSCSHSSFGLKTALNLDNKEVTTRVQNSVPTTDPNKEDPRNIPRQSTDSSKSYDPAYQSAVDALISALEKGSSRRNIFTATFFRTPRPRDRFFAPEGTGRFRLLSRSEKVRSRKKKGNCYQKRGGLLPN